MYEEGAAAKDGRLWAGDQILEVIFSLQCLNVSIILTLVQHYCEISRLRLHIRAEEVKNTKCMLHVTIICLLVYLCVGKVILVCCCLFQSRQICQPIIYLFVHKSILFTFSCLSIHIGFTMQLFMIGSYI